MNSAGGRKLSGPIPGPKERLPPPSYKSKYVYNVYDILSKCATRHWTIFLHWNFYRINWRICRVPHYFYPISKYVSKRNKPESQGVKLLQTSINCTDTFQVIQWHFKLYNQISNYTIKFQVIQRNFKLYKEISRYTMKFQSIQLHFKLYNYILSGTIAFLNVKLILRCTFIFSLVHFFSHVQFCVHLYLVLYNYTLRCTIIF